MKTSLSPTDVSCYSDEQLDANFIKARPEKWHREDWVIDKKEKSWHDVQATTISQIVKECNAKTKEDLLMLI